MCMCVPENRATELLLEKMEEEEKKKDAQIFSLFFLRFLFNSASISETVASVWQ